MQHIARHKSFKATHDRYEDKDKNSFKEENDIDHDYFDYGGKQNFHAVIKMKGTINGKESLFYMMMVVYMTLFPKEH